MTDRSEQKNENTIEQKLAEKTVKLQKAVRKIREQQHYISDLTTSPFKLFDVNTDSKQHKTHSAIVATQKKSLLLHKNALVTAMGDREMTVIKNRVKAFDLTQKIDVLTKFIEKRELIDCAIQAEEEKKDILRQQLEDINTKMKAANNAIEINRKRKREDVVDPFPTMSDYAIVTFANNLCPDAKPLDNRAAGILRINAQMTKIPAAPKPPQPPVTEPQQPPATEPVPSRQRLRKTKPVGSDLPASPTSDMDGDPMDDDEVEKALLGPIRNFIVSPPSSRRPSIASMNTSEMNEYLDDENTT